MEARRRSRVRGVRVLIFYITMVMCAHECAKVEDHRPRPNLHSRRCPKETGRWSWIDIGMGGGGRKDDRPSRRRLYVRGHPQTAFSERPAEAEGRRKEGY